MKNYIIRILVDICCKKALKYDLRKTMLVEQTGIKYLYAIGSNVCRRDKWLKRIEYLQKKIDR